MNLVKYAKRVGTTTLLILEERTEQTQSSKDGNNNRERIITIFVYLYLSTKMDVSFSEIEKKKFVKINGVQKFLSK